MGEYDFTYEIPDNFHNKLVRFLQQNNRNEIAAKLQHCIIDYEKKGFAYYEGLKGDNWNKKAVDFTLEGTKSNIDFIKSRNGILKDAIQKLLKPNTSGLLVRNLEYIISDDEIEIILPEENGESFEILSKDIYDALGKNEPTLVLDRLHTYSMKYFREICLKHGIAIEDNAGNKYPLHSLVGLLT